jgi:sugar phosphate isomerase/epimerase
MMKCHIEGESRFRSPIFIGTIVLERNRWRPGRQPTYRVSDWVERFRKAGFDGMELWENHVRCVDVHEQAAIARSGFPTAVLSSYASLDASDVAQRDEAVRLALLLGAGAIKFNLGSDPAACGAYLACLHTWRALIPDHVRFLCECHPGTVVDTPEAAKFLIQQLGPDQIEIIIHPFIVPPNMLCQWFDVLGRAITHAHIQLRDEQGRFIRLDRNLPWVRQALRIMRSYGFDGTFTIEFTEGVGAAHEDPEALFTAAVADLRTLRACWDEETDPSCRCQGPS